MLVSALLLRLISASVEHEAIAAGAGESSLGPTAQITVCQAGDLGAVFEKTADGLRLNHLLDSRTQTILATNTTPIFAMTVRQTDSDGDRVVTSATGWMKPGIRKLPHGLELSWKDPQDTALSGVAVTALVRADRRCSAMAWTLRVDNRSPSVTVQRVIFPMLSVPDLGDEGAVLFPRGPGEVQRGVWGRDFRYRGDYPGGWCAMQFAAAYRQGARPTGLYIGAHDPWGSTKNIDIKSDPLRHELRISFEVPAPGLGQPGNDFSLSGNVVWQLLRGDWFDAATVYRTWARREARWWPRLGRDGRSDTALWMRELDAWVMTGGGPDECVAAVRSFRDKIGVPVGFHWYNWHQIPFDNDYPHYFPTKTNFASGVAELQKAGVFVMPYINGRLWDTHDRGAEDAEFSSVALEAATKRQDGKAWVESYGSKETNGQPVSLAVMCPTTRLWQETVHDIVLRLLREEGTRGVYIDQIAAAAPTLCMDERHGHPTGGGCWWNKGYWAMLDSIREHMPPRSMLTTECNGEPFIRWMDGYLTWHWQYDGQVPVFPAVYGGAIQMFGRAYRGGETKDLALRMKAGQQLVFGEQIGWFDPAQASDPANLPFVRKTILTRSRFHRYFYAGEMARPPRLEGEMPRERADWQWSGEWWVATDAVLTGAWRIPREKRLLLLFANVSDKAVEATVRLEPGDVGMRAGKVSLAVSRDGGQPGKPTRAVIPLRQKLDLQPQSVFALEFKER